MTSPAAYARPGPGGDQFVEVIVDHGYRPESIVARAGAPLRLVFRRRDDDECMDRIVFSSPHFDRRLPRGTATTIVLPAQPPGEVRFTCGMGRYHGAIELRSHPTPRLAAVSAAVTAGLWRAWLFVRGLEQPTVEQQTMTVCEPGSHGARSITRSSSERVRLRSTTKGTTTMTNHPIAASGSGSRRARAAALAAEQLEQRRTARIRTAAFGLVAVAVLAGGVYLAAGDLFGQRGAASSADAIAVRLSMAGFTPAEIRVPAGQPVALELWTTDAASHLTNGVHTMISEELGLYEELPAAGVSGESRRIVEFTTPATPGTYDIYCDTCCGGQASPTMHGTLVVEA